MNLVITISRRFGTGAGVIAEELSRRLEIPVYDKAYIEHELEGESYADEAELIKELATHSCIILGRCASEILKDRIHRVMAKKSLSYEDAKLTLEQNDRARADYYYRHTGKVWGDVNNYHMILDTSQLGIDKCADILLRYFERIEII